MTVSGTGPAVLAACRDGGRRRIVVAMLDAFDDAWVYQTRVGEGVTVY